MNIHGVGSSPYFFTLHNKELFASISFVPQTVLNSTSMLRQYHSTNKSGEDHSTELVWQVYAAVAEVFNYCNDFKKHKSKYCFMVPKADLGMLNTPHKLKAVVTARLMSYSGYVRELRGCLVPIVVLFFFFF